MRTWTWGEPCRRNAAHGAWRAVGWRFSITPALAAVLTMLSGSTAAAQPVIAEGAIAGIVRDSMGIGVAGARITIAGSGRRVESDDRGRFHLPTVAGGWATLELHRIGFQTKTAYVMVGAGQTAEVVVILAPVARELAPQLVIASRRPVRSTGRFAEFNRRRDSGLGHFITRQQIERQHAVHFTDLLRQIPGVRIATGFAQSGVRLRGAKCPPHVWIDGTPAGVAEFNLDAIPPQTVEGVEIYSGVATVPAELMAGRARGQCGVIVVWTRVD